MAASSPDTCSSCAYLAESPVIGNDGRAMQSKAGMTIISCAPDGAALQRALNEVTTEKALLLLEDERRLTIDTAAIERLARGFEDAAAAYGDYRRLRGDQILENPTIAYSLGAIRDDFDFGPLVLISMKHVHLAEQPWGKLAPTRWSSWYELRLRLSRVGLVRRAAECTCTLRVGEIRDGHFDYVDPRNRLVQMEREAVATEHLKAIGAWLPRRTARPMPVGVRTDSRTRMPVEASVIIPVRSRVRTIADAVRSALSQQADFPFNVVVVDNHSTDGTSKLLDELAVKDRRLVVLRPARRDLQIGGCWNLAVASPQCGRYAVQLDSDDLYSGDETLAMMVAKLREGPYAMVVGSYRLVDFDLHEIPPGVIDHREWSDTNGHNNLLRVNGIGAPRAFDTAVLRQHPMPDVSYGEDYAVALAISRTYPVGRIYEPLYLCRRWEGNSDASPPLELTNERNLYKDNLRTREIEARKAMVSSE
ncbi:MAG TPA: glycosyltransferase family 2 protein [Phycisphaerae bacterium]|jgi:hypothetical protein